MQKDFTVRIDSILKPYIQSFLESVNSDLAKMKTAFQSNAFSEIRDIGHKIKGEGGTYGLDKISEIGKELQLAGEQEDSQTIESSLIALTEFLENLNIDFEGE